MISIGKVSYKPVRSYTRADGDPNVENMLIQGDNLEALKALLPYYAGQVKCIFIDPPYNTQSAFEHYDDNLEHSIWLSTMYPRMKMLHDLLADETTLIVAAQQAGLNVNRFQDDLDDPQLAQAARNSHAQAIERWNVSGTPTLVFPNGRSSPGSDR